MNREGDMDRSLELACDRALFGLTADGQAELQALLGQPQDDRPTDLELAAVAVLLADVRSVEPMPAALFARVLSGAGGSVQPVGRGMTVPMAKALPVLARADTVLAPASLSPAAPVVPFARAPSKPRSRWAVASGWIAAAACLALALAGWFRRGERPADLAAIPSAVPSAEVAPSAVDGRVSLLRRAKDVVKADWSPGPDAAGQGVTGDVVWSPSEQRGYMRFRGLPANDKGAIAYQLWIFDAEQDERYPVDGGVFDVDAATGDVVVPIAAKLRVRKPTLFAVTIEKPGGVVVSKRDRLVTAAKIAG